AEAQLLFERALAINEVALGVDHPSTITSRAWMADLYTKQGFLDKASPLLEEIVSARERVLGHDHPDVASALNNRALLLKAQVRAVRNFREYSCGQEAVVLLWWLFDAQQQGGGKYDEADPLYLRAIEIEEKTLGPDHPSVATSLNN
ncbi:unnamed protein product, partial [Scytosiphon promiscuus]